MDIEEVKEFISKQSLETKVYLGADSERVTINGESFADFSVCVVVHYDGCSGAKIFGEVTRQRDYDQRKDKPALRLFNEVMLVAELYNKLQDSVGDRDMEIHIDINKDPQYGSSCVVQQAIGYIKSTCYDKKGNSVTPICKPDAFSASFAADRLKRILHEQNN